MSIITLNPLGNGDVPFEVRFDLRLDPPAPSYHHAYDRFRHSPPRIFDDVRRYREAHAVIIFTSKKSVKINRVDYGLEFTVSQTSGDWHVGLVGFPNYPTLAARNKLLNDEALISQMRSYAQENAEKLRKKAIADYYARCAQVWGNVMKHAWAVFDTLPEEYRPKHAKLAIVMEGGVIQHIISDDPDAVGKAVDIRIIDYDEGTAGNDGLGFVRQDDGDYEPAGIVTPVICKSGIDLDQVWRADPKTNPYGKTPEELEAV